MADTIDTAHRTIHFERTFTATPDEVFSAWTEPEQVTQWWDPTGAPLVSCAIDLRPRGTFRFVTAGHAPPFEGVYEVIERPNRLVFNAMGAVGTIDFQPQPTGTLMRVSIRSPSAEHFEMFLKLGVNVGTSATLDNLVKLLASRSRGARKSS